MGYRAGHLVCLRYAVDERLPVQWTFLDARRNSKRLKVIDTFGVPKYSELEPDGGLAEGVAVYASQRRITS